MSWPHVWFWRVFCRHVLCRGSLKAHKKLTFLNSCTTQYIWGNGPLNRRRCQQLVQKSGSPTGLTSLCTLFLAGEQIYSIYMDPRTQYLVPYQQSALARTSTSPNGKTGILGSARILYASHSNVALSKTLRIPTRPTMRVLGSLYYILIFGVGGVNCPNTSTPSIVAN